LGCQFAPADSWAHGYNVHKLALGDATKPEWLWISPNEVPCGFVREKDPRYDELKELMCGKKKRIHTLPDNCYFLSCTEGAAVNVGKVCIESGLTIKGLREYFT
jgi:hypothetical protein